MPNPIPMKVRREIYRRATPEYSHVPSCELSGKSRACEIHHITGRHSHQPWNLIFLHYWTLHRETEQDKSEQSLSYQLKLGLQKTLLKYMDEEQTRQELGGKLYEGELTDSRVKNHFKMIERRYFNGK